MTSPDGGPATVEQVLRERGTTYAAEAGIELADEPAPLYRLLVLTTLLSARISSSVAVAAARELWAAGLTTPAAVAASDRQARVEALGRAGYRRYDERTATALGDGAARVTDRWDGDLRRLRQEVDGDVPALRRHLQEWPGIGPTGSAIFCREVQGAWPEVAPFVDERAAEGARALGLPEEPAALAALVPPPDLPRLVAACVRRSLERG